MLNVGQEIIDVLLSCFGKPFVVLAISAIALIAVFWCNAILGGGLAALSADRKFDWKIFVSSLLKTLVVFVVVMITGYVLLLIPALLQYGGLITPEIEEIIQGAISYGALLLVIISGVYKNSGDIIEKIKELLGIVKAEDSIDENCGGVGGSK